jgi:hypothetical protein
MKAIDWLAEATHRALSGHSLFGPSTLPRAMRCTGSVRLCIENDAHSVDTEYSLEGSNAHALAQRAFEYHREVKVFLGCEFQYMRGGEVVTFSPDEDMCRYVQEYIDWCTELPGDHYVETVLHFGEFLPLPTFGTDDHAAIFAETLIVTDLKYGQGEKVYAEDNEQLLAYALLFYLEWSWMYEIRKIVLRICQPRLNHFDVWECTVGQLLEFSTRMQGAVAQAISDEATLVPGELQCRFCPMSGRCAAQTEAIHKLVAGDFDSFDDPQVVGEPLSYEELGKCLELRDTVKHWLKALEKRAFEAIMRDVEVPGWKIVEGKSNRCWVNEAATEAWLTEHKVPKGKMYEKTLLSPAQAEKLFKGDQKKEVGALARKPPGRPVLAHISDKRMPFNPVADDFDNFDVDEDEAIETIDDGLGE